ncbi:hypothetical protein V6N13_093207 [Hibiscus sabdariffa]
MDDTLTRGNHLVEECSHAILAATRTTFRQVEQPRWAAPSQGLAGRGRELGSELMYFPSPPDDVRVVVEEELVEAGSVIGELTGIG